MAILKPDKTTTVDNGLKINEYLLTAHNPNKISLPAKRTTAQPLIGVTLHNTDWIKVAAETSPAEQYVRATYNGNMGDTRVHYYVDDKCAWKDLDDAYTSWHAATGGQGQGNCNTISIECIMSSQSDAASLVSMENAAKLIAWIFKQYGWTVEKNLYTHNYWTNYKVTGKCSADIDTQSLTRVSTTAKCFNSAELANASGKYCPVFILPQWEKFKTLVKKYMGTTTTAASSTATSSAAINTSSPTTVTAFKVGDIVEFTGSTHYTSSTGTCGTTAKPGKAKITIIVTGTAHPYHLIAENGGGSTVYGWVNAADISGAGSATVQIKVGSTVMLRNGAKDYNGGNLASFVYGRPHIVSELKGDRAVITFGGVVVAAVKTNDLTLA